MRDGTTPLCPATTDGTGNWACPIVALGNGTHSLSATASDGVGNASDPSSVTTVTVDTTAPDAPVITTPSDGTVTNDPDVSIAGTAEPNSTVAVVDGAVAVCSATADGAGDWACLPVVLADGAHSLTATATDAAGYASPAGAAVSVTVDTGAPDAPVITAPADGTLSNNSGLAASGTADPGSTVTVRSDGDVVCQAPADGAGAWSCPTFTVADGVHRLTATAADVAGNASAASAPVTVTVDTVAPQAPAITSPADGALTRDPAVVVSGAAEPGAVVTVRAGGAAVCTVAAGVGGAWTCPQFLAADGMHELIASAMDAAGNLSAASPPVSVTVDTVAPEPPVIASPTAGAVFADTLASSGTAEPASVVTVRGDGDIVCAVTADDAGDWACLAFTLPDGDHELTASAADAAGNTSAASDPVSVTVDTVVPVPPMITSPTAGSLFTATPSIEVTGTAEPGSDVVVSVGGVAGAGVWTGFGSGRTAGVGAAALPVGTTLCTATADGAGAWTCTTI
ncbi:Ig-like domain-containing protein, partial [Microbacterium sp.]|uniref:Ig-like domain-containing protein n=1 Tax=Microbacterium sp. TaxID=51671 RepID=UPI003A876F86